MSDENINEIEQRKALQVSKQARQRLLSQWCAKQMNLPAVTLDMVSGDASFRRYFRFSHNGTSYIAVDAPPEKENSESFVNIALEWKSQGINVPNIHAHEFELGFMLLNDFGNELLLPALEDHAQGEPSLGEPSLENADRYYPQALRVLSELAQLSPTAGFSYPKYDEALLRQELQLFDDWFYHRHLEFTDDVPPYFDALKQILIDNSLQQPQVIVHRDYHSRNIMLLENDTLGIIDFQDAVAGAITYDAVSLLKDCYIAWPRAQVLQWLERFYLSLKQQSLDFSVSFEQFIQWFDLMGLQRHIKVAGIFCRLSYRDGKSTYLDDLPLVLAYIMDVCQRYADNSPEIAQFQSWLQSDLMPAYYSGVDSDSSVRDKQSTTEQFLKRLA